MPCVIASDEGSTISMILLQQRGARSSQSSPNTTIFSSPRDHREQRSGNTSPRRRYELLHSWFLLLPTLRESPIQALRHIFWTTIDGSASVAIRTTWYPATTCEVECHAWPNVAIAHENVLQFQILDQSLPSWRPYGITCSGNCT